jgi:hypothetical protein
MLVKVVTLGQVVSDNDKEMIYNFFEFGTH